MVGEMRMRRGVKVPLLVTILFVFQWLDRIVLLAIQVELVHSVVVSSNVDVWVMGG